MTFPPDPYGGWPPYVAGSDTSEAAADSVADAADKGRARIYGYIDRHGGATCDEVEAALGLLHQNASARIRELELQGLIKKSNERRLTRHHRAARVYTTVRPAPKGF